MKKLLILSLAFFAFQAENSFGVENNNNNNNNNNKRKSTTQLSKNNTKKLKDTINQQRALQIVQNSENEEKEKLKKEFIALQLLKAEKKFNSLRFEAIQKKVNNKKENLQNKNSLSSLINLLTSKEEEYYENEYDLGSDNESENDSNEDSTTITDPGTNDNSDSEDEETILFKVPYYLTIKTTRYLRLFGSQNEFSQEELEFLKNKTYWFAKEATRVSSARGYTDFIKKQKEEIRKKRKNKN